MAIPTTQARITTSVSTTRFEDLNRNLARLRFQARSLLGGVTGQRLPILNLLGKRPFGQGVRDVLNRVTTNWRRSVTSPIELVEAAPAPLEPAEEVVPEAKAPEAKPQSSHERMAEPGRRFLVERSDWEQRLAQKPTFGEPSEEVPAKASRAFGSTREVHFVG